MQHCPRLTSGTYGQVLAFKRWSELQNASMGSERRTSVETFSPGGLALKWGYIYIPVCILIDAHIYAHTHTRVYNIYIYITPTIWSDMILGLQGARQMCLLRWWIDDISPRKHEDKFQMFNHGHYDFGCVQKFGIYHQFMWCNGIHWVSDGDTKWCNGI